VVRQIQRKTAQTMGKTVILPPLRPFVVFAVGKPKISAGGTATGFMTNDAHFMIAASGVAACNRARAFMQPRPSLGSSHALLLLSCP
jgi:hypothetical protein